MLYSEQVVDQSFDPVLGARSLFTMSLIGEINNLNPSLFYRCGFNAGNNRGALLINNTTNTVFRECSFSSGRENCVKISRAKSLLFEDCDFKLNGDRQISIESGSNSIRFSNCRFTHSSENKGVFALVLGPWTEEEKVWRPPVSNIEFEGCHFDLGVTPYIAFRALKPNIEGKVIKPWLVEILWFIARKILRKKEGFDYTIYEHEQV